MSADYDATSGEGGLAFDLARAVSEALRAANNLAQIPKHARLHCVNDILRDAGREPGLWDFSRPDLRHRRWYARTPETINRIRIELLPLV